MYRNAQNRFLNQMTNKQTQVYECLDLVCYSLMRTNTNAQVANPFFGNLQLKRELFKWLYWSKWIVICFWHSNGFFSKFFCLHSKCLRSIERESPNVKECISINTYTFTFTFTFTWWIASQRKNSCINWALHIVQKFDWQCVIQNV